MRTRSSTVVAVVLFAAGLGFAQGRGRTAPLPPNVAKVEHAPFMGGECGTCHARNDMRDPGPILRASDQLCFDCHDEYRTARTMVGGGHRDQTGNCTSCHNPHNATRRGLLL